MMQASIALAMTANKLEEFSGKMFFGWPGHVEILNDEQSSVLLLPNTAKQVREDQITSSGARPAW